MYVIHIHRGYYMPARGYEFYLQVFNSISRSFAALTHEISNWTLVKHTNNDVFVDFPKISEHFPKIYEDFPKLFRRLGEHLQTFFKHFPKIAKNFRRLPKISEGSWRFLKRYPWCFDHTTPPLSTFWAIMLLYTCSNSNLRTCDNNLLFSRVKISCYIYLHVWRYHVYVRKLTWYFTGVYIVKVHDIIWIFFLLVILNNFIFLSSSLCTKWKLLLGGECE